MTVSPQKNPVLSFKEDGSPYSNEFDDIYFDSESGYQQSEFIFLQGNNIEKRLLASVDSFTIAETGFGTGLNFLLTLQLYQKLLAHKNAASLPQLHFISTEKYPLTKAQLCQSLQALLSLEPLAKRLIAQYPCVENTASMPDEFTASFLNNHVQLTVIMNDAATGLSKLDATKKGLIDAWYLDGFSPAKNPEMWSEALFIQISRLSKSQASVATFTVAGFVKRHLQKAGFRIEKKPYIGNKKEILTGIFQQNITVNNSPIQGYQLRPLITKPQQVSIIGGGIASACAAYALTKQGVKVTLYCQDETLAQGGSSNAIGALYPLLHQKKDDISLFYQQAFWRAKDFYQQIINAGFNFPHQWCGLLEVSYKEALVKRQNKFSELNIWPKALIHSVDDKQTSTIANIPLQYGGLFMPNAGWLAPQLAVQQIIKAAKATNRLKIKTNIRVESIQENTQDEQTRWTLTTNKGNFTASTLVICGGGEAIDLPFIKQLPFSVVRGQVTSMKTNAVIDKLATVICHKGYLTPRTRAAENGDIHCIGATFEKGNTSTEASSEEDEYNLNMLAQCLPELANKINWTKTDIQRSRARLRCMTPDHMPMVGAMPNIQAHINNYPHLAKDKNWRYTQPAPVLDNLYIMMGFGARGLCSAPLAADILTADLCGTPYPVDDSMLFNLSPNRFVIRDMIKRKI